MNNQPEPAADSSYLDGMRQARRNREARSPHLLRYMFPGLLPPVAEPRREPTAGESRWSVRGEPRTRDTYAGPHPLDFPGGLPLPGDYPTAS